MLTIASKQFTAYLKRDDVEFILHNEEANQTTFALRNHIMIVKAPLWQGLAPDKWMREGGFARIECEALHVGPRENLVIIPPPMGPQGPIIAPGFIPRR